MYIYTGGRPFRNKLPSSSHARSLVRSRISPSDQLLMYVYISFFPDLSHSTNQVSTYAFYYFVLKQDLYLAQCKFTSCFFLVVTRA